MASRCKVGDRNGPNGAPDVKILSVVEDDPQMIDLIKVNLGFDSRLEVAGASGNAPDAIELATSMQPHLIILDHLIDGDVMGLDAAPQLKAAAPQAKILLFTAHQFELEASRSAAIDGFLSRNDVTKLPQTVRTMLGLEPLS